MPIAASDIKFYLSGGTGNSDPNASLGGARSTSTQITAASLHNLFDIVSSAEALAGENEYRCFYVRNEHGSLTLSNARIFVQTNTPSAETSAAIALGGEGKNGTAETIANENTAPAGETFSAPVDYANGLALGDLAPNDFFPIWVRRTIDANCDAANADSVVIRVQGDTLA